MENEKRCYLRFSRREDIFHGGTVLCLQVKPTMLPKLLFS